MYCIVWKPSGTWNLVWQLAIQLISCVWTRKSFLFLFPSCNHMLYSYIEGISLNMMLINTVYVGLPHDICETKCISFRLNICWLGHVHSCQILRYGCKLLRQMFLFLFFPWLCLDDFENVCSWFLVLLNENNIKDLDAGADVLVLYILNLVISTFYFVLVLGFEHALLYWFAKQILSEELRGKGATLQCF